MRLLIVLALVALIAISGCVGFDIGSLFQWGSDVIKVSESTYRDPQRDIITISNKQTIPTSGNILPEKPVVFSYILKNNDDLEIAEKVKTDLFDAPVFRTFDAQLDVGERCNSASKPCQPNPEDSNICSEGAPCSLSPGEERLIKYNIFSPTQEEIVNIRTQPRLSFDVKYDYKSTLFFVFPVVNFNEVVKRQRAGEAIDLRMTKSQSSGPLQVEADLVGENYGLADYPVTVIFKIKNTGSGSVLDSKIQKEKLLIVIPRDFDIVGFPDKGYPKEYFACAQTFESIECRNDLKEIDMYLDETQVSLRFEIKLTNSQMANPFRSFQIASEVSYTYELRDYLDVTINPFGNV